MADYSPYADNNNSSMTLYKEKIYVSKFFDNTKDGVDDNCLPNKGFHNEMFVDEDSVRNFKDFSSEYSLSQCSSNNTSEYTTSDEESNNSNLSQLSLNENEKICIDPLYNISPRLMPNSPHHVIEEEFKSNPWAMLIATIFLTKTSAKVARPFMKNFFEEFPTPYHLLETNPFDLERFFVTLGLRKRGHMIWKMSYQFVSAKWTRASDLCGIGKYGEDAYRLFCLGHTDVEPTDRYLKLYLDWLRGKTDFLEDCGIEDCAHSILFDDPVMHYYSLTLR